MIVLPRTVRDRIQKFYQGLSSDAQAMVTVLVVLRERHGMSSFAKAMNRTSINRQDGNQWTNDDVRQLYVAIEKAKLGRTSSGRPLIPIREFLVGIAEMASATQSLGELAARVVEPPSPYVSFHVSDKLTERLAHGYYWDGNGAMLQEVLVNEKRYTGPMTLQPAQLDFISEGFCAERFAILPEVYRTKLIPIIRDTLTWDLRYLSQWTVYLQQHERDAKLLAPLGEALLLDARFTEADGVAEQLLASKSKYRKVEGFILKGLLAFLQGVDSEAAAAIKQGLALRASPLKIVTAIDALVTVFLSTQQDPGMQAAVLSASARKQTGPAGWVEFTLHKLANINDDETASTISHYELSQAVDLPSLAQLIMLHAWLWRSDEFSKEAKALANKLLVHCQAQQSPLAASVLSHMLGKSKSANSKIAPWIFQKLRLEPWERQLAQLEQFALEQFPETARELKNASNNVSRLVWELNVNRHDLSVTEVIPREQKCGKGGRWTAGRPVSLKRLYEQASQLKCVTPADLLVVQQIRPIPWPRNQFELRVMDALIRLAGHPLVFRGDQPGQAIEIVQHQLKFILTENASDQAAQLVAQPSLENLWFTDDGLANWWETPNRLGMMRISDDEHRIVKVLGLMEGPCSIPPEGRERLLKVVEVIKEEIQVFTDVDDANSDIKVAVVAPNLTLQLHLSPWLDGLRVALLAQPLNGLDLHMPPGSGSQVLFGEIDGRPSKTQRSLSEEVARASEVLRACPSLQQNEPDKPFQWSLPDPEDCLELLTEAQAIDDRLEVHWPQGERFRIASEPKTSQMRLKVTARKDWFEVSGELAVADGEVMQLQTLLDLLEKDDQFGRFVKLRDGQFMALTREFRQRLQDLDTFTTEGKNGSRRVHPLAAHAITELTEETDSKVAKKWITHVERLRDAAAYEPDLPSTLQAELRPYQLEGFQWLARQAHWGVGACLADDMGLGKTVQALALLLHRASLGPALVVAPTSVTRNWLAETLKFAPTLKTRLYGPGDRVAALKDLSGFDLVICTYGLLPIEINQLGKIKWATIVLDEAQAIKNASTQRWKAAVKLNGDFKVITTGTPIENHVAELFALFQFINPGLLGTAQRFHVKFVDPISKEREDGARLRLKRFIRPFILRRLKNQVLQDLPPRTDIVLRVEPSSEETAFYEALRRNAVKRLTAKKNDDENPGERSLRILAEIMKLRRACCHPQLVDAKVPFGSSKLVLFADTLDEILANGHKALVFSQFVDHLAYLREHLDKAKISYQYLDGQTPAKKRQEAVNAFQSGEGDVFLISLRAGGTGLNLTAADYVMHMDPWWNPAVEDQASDRAHRIGQRRPVTVYRFVVANTIEEKIVELHHRKRDLADSLLAGADSAGKLSPDQLLNLLRDER